MVSGILASFFLASAAGYVMLVAQGGVSIFGPPPPLDSKHLVLVSGMVGAALATLAASFAQLRAAWRRGAGYAFGVAAAVNAVLGALVWPANVWFFPGFVLGEVLACGLAIFLVNVSEP
ncbi:MAG: hypothetical protein ACYDDF_03255 [Thermoplasmatota archaeon]